MPRGQRNTTTNTNNAPSMDATTRAIVRSEMARVLSPFFAAFSSAGTSVVTRRRRGPNKKKVRSNKATS